MEASELDALIREARHEARAAVKARLRERFERELLEEAERRLSAPPDRPVPPAPAEQGEGLWVYCVADAAHPGVEDGVEGIAAGAPPYAVEAGGLCALVSAVPLSEFGEQGLARNLNDLSWLETMARAHESVLDAALARGAVVPLRVCTIYRGEEQVCEQLSERAGEFRDALGWLDGRAEWGVKVIAAREQAEQVDTDPHSGAGYLAGKQQARRERERADARIAEAVRECHARLEEWAAGARVLPPQRRELAGYEGEMVLNGAYLVDDDRVERFETVVEELRGQYAASGLAFELTGPWPAYHFTGRLETLGEGVA